MSYWRQLLVLYFLATVIIFNYFCHVTMQTVSGFAKQYKKAILRIGYGVAAAFVTLIILKGFLGSEVFWRDWPLHFFLMALLFWPLLAPHSAKTTFFASLFSFIIGTIVTVFTSGGADIWSGFLFLAASFVAPMHWVIRIYLPKENLLTGMLLGAVTPILMVFPGWIAFSTVISMIAIIKGDFF